MIQFVCVPGIHFVCLHKLGTWLTKLLTLGYFFVTPPHHCLRCPLPIIVAMQLSQQILLLCLAHCYGKKGRAKFMHSCYRKDFFKTLPIEERWHQYRKILWCALILLALLMAKITSFLKWSSLYHNDGIWHRILWQNFGEIKSNVFRTHNFWTEQDGCWVWVHSWAKERSSAQGLSRACDSVVTHQRFVECLTACVWTYLFKPFHLSEIWFLDFCQDLSKRSPCKSEHPLMGGNRIIPSGVCGATPTSERLLGNHGWTEVVFAINGTCRYPGTVLQWMNTQPLCYVCFLLLPRWYNSDCLLQHPWICTRQSGSWVWQYLQ